MQIDFTQPEISLLSEILHNHLKQLMVETNRADSMEYKKDLHNREELIEAIQAKLLHPAGSQPELLPEALKRGDEEETETPVPEVLRRDS